MRLCALSFLIVLLTTLHSAVAATWQWSVPIEPAPGRQDKPRGFLWIPENCPHVRGIVFGHHNMEEESILEHPKFRQALTELGFAEIWVAPSFDPYFRFDLNAGQRFDGLLKSLADVSGYTELTTAPLVPIGHSAAASMPWYIAMWRPQRVIACISVSGQWPYVPDQKNAPQGIGVRIDNVPGIVTLGEYEWADERLPVGGKTRLEHPTMPLSALGCPADGHFEATDEKIEFLALYVKKAAQYRLPKDAPSDGRVALIPIDPTKTGWLADRWRSNKDPIAPPAPVTEYQGDPADAFWWFDEEIARAAVHLQSLQRGKTPLLGYVQGGQVVPQIDGTHQQVTLKFNPGDDGITFKLTPTFLDTVPQGRPERWTGKKAGEKIEVPLGGPPSEIRRITGPVKKISDDTWQLDLNRASFLSDPRGNEAWLVAIYPGNDEFKRMVQQSVLRIPKRNDKGAEQSIAFPPIPDQRVGAIPFKLAATATSGMPVHYYVREGPAEVDDNGVLTLTSIPPGAKLPVKVTVIAWQWGRSAEPQINSAEPVEQTFQVNPK